MESIIYPGFLITAVGIGLECLVSMLTRRSVIGGLAAMPAVSASHAAEPVKIRFGLGFQFVADNPFTSGSPLATAHDAFYFEQEFRNEPNVQIEWLRMKGHGPQLNEAFASQALACARDLGIRDETLNIDGGAIALGHPLGATGARIVGKAASLLQRVGGRYALATQCIGGGQGIATILERI